MSLRSVLLLLGLLVGALLAPPPAASADPCTSNGGIADSALLVGVTCTSPADFNSSDGSAQSAGSDAPVYVEYQWNSVCVPFNDNATVASQPDCTAALVCPQPGALLYDLWGKTPSGAWVALGSQCFSEPPTAADTPRPTVTPALVLTELRRVGLPAVQARTQPEDKTLVNFDTIFYAEAEPVTTTLRLLGQDVTVEATPATFTWHHGDATTTTTDHPGAPYPAKDITHAYQHAHTTVTPRVDATYTGRFRVDTGAWQDIGGTITIPGPPTPLRIAEAVAVLSGTYD